MEVFLQQPYRPVERTYNRYVFGRLESAAHRQLDGVRGNPRWSHQSERVLL